MSIKIKSIPHKYRNKYLRDGGGTSINGNTSIGGGNITGGSGLPYTLDEDGNYVIEKKITVKGHVVSEGEVSAWGAGTTGGDGGGNITVIDNLTSTSKDSALSANQGRILKGMIDNFGGGISEVNWSDIKNKPTAFTPSEHVHIISNITGLQTALDGKVSSTTFNSHANNSDIHITATERTKWNNASTNSHTHNNKSVLDGISLTDITSWNNKLDKSVWDKVFYFDTDNNLKVKLNLVGEKEVAAWGSGSLGGETGLITIVDNLTSTSKDSALSANQGRVLKGLIDSKVSTVNWSEIVGKPSTFTPSAHIHTISDITSLQTTLDGKSGTGHTHNKLSVEDIRSSNHSPNDSTTDKTLRVWFNNTGTPDSNWWSGITVKGWTNNYEVWQLSSKAHSFNNNTSLHYRTGFSTTWNPWRTVLDSSNYTSTLDTRYVKKAGDTMSGALTISNGYMFLNNGWFQNNTTNTGLYNSAGNARWRWDGSSWAADKAITSTSTIRGTQLQSTVATGTAPLTVASTTVVTNLNADMVDGVHASDMRPVVSLSNFADYCYTVIGLCPLSNTNIGATYYSFGDIYIKRNNGNGGIISRVNYAVEKIYNSTSAKMHLYVSQHTSSVIQACTFMYGGTKWAGLRVYPSAATFSNNLVFIYGKWTNTPFTVNYYNTNTSVVNNAEINNSIVLNGSDISYSPAYINGTSVALTTSNVASATKLLNARTIWGQSFNGTANISGNMTGVGNISMTGALAGATTGNFSSTLAVGGRATLNGGANVGYTNTNYSISCHNFISNSWVYTNGNTGWYSVTHGGGIHMTDATWVRTYNDKKIYVSNTSTDAIYTIGGFKGKNLRLPYDAGTWISMATRSTLLFGEINNSTSSAHGLFRLKNSNGDAVVYGGLGTNIGFYGFKASRITAGTNGTDWSTTWDVSSGNLSHSGLLGTSNTTDATSSTSVAAIYTAGGIRATKNIRTAANVIANGEVTAYSSSDKRLKKNIKPLSNCLETILKLNPITFKWNGKARELNDTKDDRLNYGLVAQEVEEVAPELVHEIYDKYKSVDYEQLIPLLIGSIQELRKEIQDLKSKIK